MSHKIDKKKRYKMRTGTNFEKKKIVTLIFIQGICIPNLVQIRYIGIKKHGAKFPKKCHHHEHLSFSTTLGGFWAIFGKIQSPINIGARVISACGLLQRGDLSKTIDSSKNSREKVNHNQITGSQKVVKSDISESVHISSHSRCGLL